MSKDFFKDEYDEPFCEKCGGEGIISDDDDWEYCDCHEGHRRREQDEAMAWAAKAATRTGQPIDLIALAEKAVKEEK